MPEQEGYVGIISLLTRALELMPNGEPRELVSQARAETIRQMKQSVTSLEIGIDLGKLLSDEERKQ